MPNLHAQLTPSLRHTARHAPPPSAGTVKLSYGRSVKLSVGRLRRRRAASRQHAPTLPPCAAAMDSRLELVYGYGYGFNRQQSPCLDICYARTARRSGRRRRRRQLRQHQPTPQQYAAMFGLDSARQLGCLQLQLDCAVAIAVYAPRARVPPPPPRAHARYACAAAVRQRRHVGYGYAAMPNTTAAAVNTPPPPPADSFQRQVTVQSCQELPSCRRVAAHSMR